MLVFIQRGDFVETRWPPEATSPWRRQSFIASKYFTNPVSSSSKIKAKL